MVTSPSQRVDATGLELQEKVVFINRVAKELIFDVRVDTVDDELRADGVPRRVGRYVGNPSPQPRALDRRLHLAA